MGTQSSIAQIIHTPLKVSRRVFILTNENTTGHSRSWLPIVILPTSIGSHKMPLTRYVTVTGGLTTRILCDTFAVNFKEAIELIDRNLARNSKLKQRLDGHRSLLTTEWLIPLSLLLALLWFVAMFLLVRQAVVPAEILRTVLSLLRPCRTNLRAESLREGSMQQRTADGSA